jgi:hypothetical protein
MSDYNRGAALIVPSQIFQGPASSRAHVVAYPCTVGPYHVLGLEVRGRALYEALSQFCSDRGYTPGGHPLRRRRGDEEGDEDDDDTVYVMTKLPILLVITLMGAQSDEVAAEMVGAWPVAMDPAAKTVWNLVCGTTRGGANDARIVEKVSLYYPYGIPLDRTVPVAIHEGLSFRTGVVDLPLEAARSLLRNAALDATVQFDSVEDAVFFRKDVPVPFRLEFARRLVRLLKATHSDVLSPSRSTDGATALDDEFGLFCKLVHSQTFAVSTVRRKGQTVCEPYGRRQCEKIVDAYARALATHPRPLVPRVLLGGPRWHYGPPVAQEALPDFHGARIEMCPATSSSSSSSSVEGAASSSTHLQAVQRTSSGGFRLVFLVTIERGETTFFCPATGTTLPVPAYVRWGGPQRAQWCWHDGSIRPGEPLLPQLRDVNPTGWTFYTTEQSTQIEQHAFAVADAAVAGDQASECTVGVGVTTLRIQLGGPDLRHRTLGVQLNGPRKHFVKRVDIALQEYEEQRAQLRREHSEMILDASGDTSTCGICLEALADSSCKKLAPCKHVFHKLCIDTYLNSAAGPSSSGKCPYCKSTVAHHSGRQSSGGYHDGYHDGYHGYHGGAHGQS